MLTCGPPHSTADTKEAMSAGRPAGVWERQTDTKPALLRLLLLLVLLLSPQLISVLHPFMASLSLLVLLLPPPIYGVSQPPEWALWLVNKSSDSGGGQLQPC